LFYFKDIVRFFLINLNIICVFNMLSKNLVQFNDEKVGKCIKRYFILLDSDYVIRTSTRERSDKNIHFLSFFEVFFIINCKQQIAKQFKFNFY